MLVLSRNHGESVQVGEARVFAFRTPKALVKLGIDAPKHITILRTEIKGRTLPELLQIDGWDTENQSTFTKCNMSLEYNDEELWLYFYPSPYAATSSMKTTHSFQIFTNLPEMLSPFLHITDEIIMGQIHRAIDCVYTLNQSEVQGSS